MDGLATYRGVDLSSLPASRAINFTYYAFTLNMNKDERAKFDGILKRPPVGGLASKGSREKENNALRALVTATGGL